MDRSNVFLCLDPSHACTYAHTFVEVEKRRERMMAFLNAGEALRHVHWNGNDLESVKGRRDMHMCIGADTLPRAFHRAVKGLDCYAPAGAFLFGGRTGGRAGVYREVVVEGSATGSFRSGHVGRRFCFFKLFFQIRLSGQAVAGAVRSDGVGG